MKFLQLLSFALLFSAFGYSQTKDTIIVVESKVVVQIPDSVSVWKRKNTVGFDLSEIAFVNWNAGGVSSVSGLAKAAFSRILIKDKIKWGNELLIRYGVNKQDGIEWRKTDDALALNSTFGFRKDTITNWYHSAKFNFNTQFTSGYNYPNTDEAISKAFAPAYIFFGVGAEYSNKKEKINIYLSPLTMKTTLVLDQRLADLGSFGVEKAEYDEVTGERLSAGKNVRTEVGILITSHFKRQIMKNITYENRLNLYTDYLNNFGNIDLDWQGQIDLVVNQYVKANIGFHVIYDDDIKATKKVDGHQVPAGPKIQLKQMLGIGMVYNF